MKSRPIPTFWPGWNSGADLADEDVPRHDRLGAVHLDAAVLAGRVAPVARRALSFFVSHGACLLRDPALCPDGGDEDLGEGLPVAALLGPAFLLLAEV